MALIQCCECETKVSEFAETCPTCGCPVSISLAKNAEAAKEAEQRKAEEEIYAAEKVAEKERKAENRRQKFQANKKRIIFISLLSVVVFFAAAAYAIYYGYLIPQKAAFVEYITAIEEYNAQVKEYNAAVKNIANAVVERDELLTNANSLLNSDALPFDENTKLEFATAVKALEEEGILFPESLEQIESITPHQADEKLGPKNLEAKTIELVNEIDKLYEQAETVSAANKAIDAEGHIHLMEDLSAKMVAFEDSVKVEKQLTNPEEDFIIERLCNAASIVNTAAVTEDHDPNGKLHKPGGYTSQIYFSITHLPTNVSGAVLIDAGTACGGSIEVYASKEDAEKRDVYLGSFDGTILDSGSHTVIGSIIIRTSSKLTATDQQTLTQELIDTFTALD